MIPGPIAEYLENRNIRFWHHSKRRVVDAQRFAHREHLPGGMIAKPVIVNVDGTLVMAVVTAEEHVNVDVLRRALGGREARLALETEFGSRFQPCEVGAEPPLGLFGLPIYADEQVAKQSRMVTRAGTHHDTLEIETEAWLRAEDVKVIANLGLHT